MSQNQGYVIRILRCVDDSFVPCASTGRSRILIRMHFYQETQPGRPRG